VGGQVRTLEERLTEIKRLCPEVIAIEVLPAEFWASQGRLGAKLKIDGPYASYLAETRFGPIEVFAQAVESA